MNFNLQHRKYDMKHWLKTVRGVSNLNIDRWLSSSAGVRGEGVINLNVSPLEQKDLQDNVMTHVLGAAIVQTFSIKKGLQVFGEKGKEAVGLELQQMQDMAVCTPVDASKLTPKQRKNVFT